MTFARDRSSSVMVNRIEAFGFRSLRYVSQRLGPFHVLVGPNASGKSAFLDVLAFLADLQRIDLEHAIMGYLPYGVPVRATDPRQLTWMGNGESFELALEIGVPGDIRHQLQRADSAVCRYEIAIKASEPYGIMRENLWLKPPSDEVEARWSTTPKPDSAPTGIVKDPERRAPAGWRRVIHRDHEAERVTFRSETSSWSVKLRISKGRSALSGLPAEKGNFPVAWRFHRMLTEGVQRIALSSDTMRRTSPPARSTTLRPDGSNLPHVVDSFMNTHPDRYEDWLMHVQEALPDIKQISTRMQPWDHHRYLVIQYRTGLEAPSWVVSEGTFRFLALTLLAYLPGPGGPFLIKEPENGIHPLNVELVLQSLSSVYGSQVLVATHSPDVARLATVDQLLCFARDSIGGTDVVVGSAHPRLQHWTGPMDLGLLLGSGVLGDHTWHA